MTTTTLTRAPLTVSTEVRVTIRSTVDLVAWFTGFDEKFGRPSYWAQDLSDYMDFPWERPIAYLDATVRDAAGDAGNLGFGVAGRTRTDTDERGARVEQRYGVDARGMAAGQWTEDDFDALVAAVPWMRPAHCADGTYLEPETMNVPFDGLEAL